MIREGIFTALFDLANGMTWGSPPRSFVYSSRRVKLWSDLPGQPALCQAEHDEEIVQTTRLESKTTLNASWLIYQNIGADPTATPTTENNLIMDAVQALFPDDPEMVQTLNGMVHYCRISGKIFKDPGDLDDQGLLIVPISILVP